MVYRIVQLGCLGLMVALFAACRSSQPEPSDSPTVEETPKAEAAPRVVTKSKDPKDLAKANNAFGLKLLQAMHERGKNSLVSPIAVATTLQILAEGAKGETKAELESVLGTTAVDCPAAYAALLKSLPTRGPKPESEDAQYQWEERTDIRLANAVYFNRNHCELNDPFASGLRESFGADVRALDFADASASNHVNEWVAKSTNDQVMSVIDDFDRDDIRILLSAISFRTRWRTMFERSKTKDGVFFLTSRETEPVRMMAREGWMWHLEADGFQGVKLSMIGSSWVCVLLPDEGVTTASVVEHLTEGGLDEVLTFETSAEGTVELPRFKIEASGDLTSALKGMGLDGALGSTADLSGFGEPPSRGMPDSTTKQSASLTLNEQGCAALSVVANRRPGWSGNKPPFHLVFDRPFVVLVGHEPTGSLFFAGVVSNPQNPKD